MLFLKFLLYFLMINTFLYYSFVAVKHLNDGSLALLVLGSTVAIGFIIVLYKVVTLKLKIKKFFFVLAVFLAYLALNLAINIPNELHSHLTGTDGGVLLFYSLGVLLAFGFFWLRLSEKQKYFALLFNTFYILTVSNFAILFYNAYDTISANVIREDILLVEDEQVDYQRGGIYLNFAFFIYSFLSVYLFLLNKHAVRYVSRHFINLAFFAFYCANTGLAILMAQMFGSNNAMVILLGLLLATFAFYIFIYLPIIKLFLQTNLISSKTVIVKFCKSIAIASGLILIVVLLVLQISGFDVEKLRIFGYGSGEISSVSSRIELLPNFLVQFEYNPFFGNMAVDYIVGGGGDYAHSLPLSLLSHCGMVGFFVFFIYFFWAIKSAFYSSRSKLDFLLSIYFFSILFGVIVVASAATFFTDALVWFMLGFVLLPISIKNSWRVQI